jgi:lambda repressor-like predicted transcriptional regulator
VDANGHVGTARQRKRLGPTYEFRDGVWDVIADLMKWPTVSAAAKDLGVSDTTLSRAISGECAPGEVLMARLMAVLPRSWKHEHVFELCREQVPA